MHLIKKLMNGRILWKMAKNLPHVKCGRCCPTISRNLQSDLVSVLKGKTCDVTLLATSKNVILQRTISARETTASITQRAGNAISANATIVCHVREERSGDDLFQIYLIDLI